MFLRWREDGNKKIKQWISCLYFRICHNDLMEYLFTLFSPTTFRDPIYRKTFKKNILFLHVHQSIYHDLSKSTFTANIQRRNHVSNLLINCAEEWSVIVSSSYHKERVFVLQRCCTKHFQFQGINCNENVERETVVSSYLLQLFYFGLSSKPWFYNF